MTRKTFTAMPGQWPMTGRDDEVRVILDRVAAGGHVVLAGHTGVGKTTLSRYVADRLQERGTPLVRVKATDAARAIPLGAFSTVLREPLPTGASALELMMTVSAQLLAQGPDGLLLLVDDAHLLDPVSATLVGHLVTTGAVTLLATVRTGAACEDVIRDLWKDRTAQRIDVQALSQDEVATLLHTVFDGSVARSLVRWAFDTSQGNPLYLREIVEGAVSQGSVRLVDGLWLLHADPVPSERLVDVVRARMGDLDEAHQRAMQLLALGEPLPLAAWTHLVEATVARSLESRGLVAITVSGSAAEAAVGHPLYGEVVRLTTTAGAARDLRIELAAVLQTTPSGRHDDELRCASWLLDAGQTPDAATLAAAATQAAAASAHPLAVRLATAALEQGDDLRVVLLAAASLRATGRFDAAEALLAPREAIAARALAAEPDLARAYLFTRVATLHWGLDRYQEARAFLERAAAWTDHPGWAYAVRAQHAVVLATGGDVAAAVGEGAQLLADPALHPAARLPLSVGHAFALHQSGRVKQSLTLLDDAVAAAGSTAGVDWPPDAMWAIVAIAGGLEWPQARRRLLRLRETALADRDVSTAGYAELLLGRLALETGRVNAAAGHLIQAEDHLSVQDSRRLMGSCRALRVTAKAMAGTYDDPSLQQWVTERAAGAPDPWICAADLAQADVWVWAVRGQLEVAVRRGLAFVERCADAPLTAGALLHTLVRVGHRPAAVLAQVRATAAACDAPIGAARVAHVAGLAARDPGRLLDAADRFEAIGALLCAAESVTAAAGLLHLAGDGSAGAATARAARLRAGAAGANTPGLHVAAEVAGLTQREREVAALAAQGLSNAEIADRLVLSSRTVESHLYRASMKLGVSRREQLTGLLA